MSDTSRSNESERSSENASTEPGAPKSKGFTVIHGFSEETRRRLAGSTVVSVPRVSGTPTRDASVVI